MYRKENAVVLVLRRGHTLSSLVAFVPVGLGRAKAERPPVVRRAQCWFLGSHRHAGRKASTLLAPWSLFTSG